MTVESAAAISADESVSVNTVRCARTAIVMGAIKTHNCRPTPDLCVHCTAAPGLLVCLGYHQEGSCSVACQQVPGGWGWRAMQILHLVFIWNVASCAQGGPQESVQHRAQRAGSAG